MSKVALIRCETYDENTVYEAVKRGLDYFGGITHFVSPEQKILLKPNLLRPMAADAACTTHPAVFEAVVRLLQEANCGKLTYGDSPGRGNPERVAEESGIADVARDYGIPLGKFTTGHTVQYSEGQFVKRFEVAEAVLEADAVISLCKMKTHGLTRLTGAVKNTYGCVYGFNKGEGHSRFPNVHDFSKMLIDLNTLVGPKLYIMDGVMAMEGNGPGSGTPVTMNAILISEDPVAIDTLFAHMVAINPDYVPTNVYGAQMGFGHNRLEDIEVVGDDLESFVNPDFEVERIPVADEGGISRLKYLKGLITRRPAVNKDKCIGCGVCMRACPLKPKAITMTEGGENRYPQYDYHRCIRCYCCQEMCPEEAITVKTPFLGKLFIYR